MDFSVEDLKNLLDKFLRLPTPYKLSIAPVLSLLLVVGYVYVVWQPKQDEIRRIDSQYQKIQREVATAQAAANNLEAFKEELADLEMQLEEVVR